MENKKENMNIKLLPLLIARVFQLRARTSPRLAFANIAEGTHAGNITKKTDGAITTRYLLAKRGSDDDHITPCTAATDIPLGVITDEAAAAEEPVNMALLGSRGETLRITLGGTVAQGDFLTTDSTGKAQKLPATTGTYYIIGRALAAGVSGDVIEFDPIPAVQRVV